MKRITVVLQREEQDREIGELLRHNLQEVLEDHVLIEVVFLDQLKDDYSFEYSDIVLVLIFDTLYKLKNKLHGNDNKIVLASRTLTQEVVNQINEIPPDTNVLVVNNAQESTHELLMLLYQLGIIHLNLVSYDKNITDVSEFNYAIIAGKNKCILENIKQIINVRYRRLDTQAFLSIFSKLRIENDKITKNLLNYIMKLPKKNTDVEERYIDSYLLSKTLLKVLEIQAEGIIVVDTNYKIIYGNKKIDEILLTTFKHGDLLNDQLDEEFKKMLLKDFRQGLIKKGNEFILVKKYELMSMDEIVGYYFNLNTATNINEVGTELSIKLRKMGLYAKYSFDDFLYKSSKMRECIFYAKKVALTDYTVLINGETGTGKELMAQSIHNFSKRKDKPFVAVNCAAFPEALLESELFGYEGGSFTGSKKTGKVGLLELANHGTIFLDEIGDMPISLQSKMLRALQEKQIMRVGSNNLIDIDVRVITATNKDIIQEMRNGNFREDLYFRLCAFVVMIPPLRERREDILFLFERFVKEDYNYLEPSDKDKLVNHRWVGNVRELSNIAAHFQLMKNIACMDVNQFYIKNDRNDINYKEEVLRVLFLNQKTGIGRNVIQKILSQNGTYISEKRLEKLLAILKEEGYISRKKGRGGIRILEKGIDFCREIE